ncbi:hypothetical protein LO80_09455 [Candidatus Francisella endociliophora]|uniref:DOMON domain-containing protein n=1 Tax=Candidatus Francisella endociliophora TaxID=653937 RepID=A0A097ERH7_9GAMM|nr:hypothetical protein [Francisella sp. FSC1006]AIT10175.1 hypothetical protein LO80_09455 [Francisella sp. FSC1006]
MRKVLPISLAVLFGSLLVSCSSSNSSDTESQQTDTQAVAQQSTQEVATNNDNICPTGQQVKTIDMQDMTFLYFKYEDHICATLKVDLDKDKTKDWSKDGSGWFAAGFGAPTMKGSNMFIFVPTNTDTKDTQYDVFANIGGAYGPTKPLDTKPADGQISLLSSSLGQVSFAIYPNNVDGVNIEDKKVDMIFSHSKAGATEFAPGHIAKYDGLAMDFE